MPLPKPHTDEDKDEFIGRCMANPTMRDEFPDGAQRRAVCERQWDEDGKAMEPDEADGLGRPVAAIKDYHKLCASVHVVKGEGGDDRRLTVGLMTVGSVDSDMEIVDQKTAFKSMGGFVAAGGPVLLNHDHGGACGRCIAYQGMQRHSDGGWAKTDDTNRMQAIQVTTEVGRGYKFATFWHGSVSVDDVWEQVRQRMMPAHSIGFQGFTSDKSTEDFTDAVTGETRQARRIFVRRTMEYSFVTIPTQQEAALAVQLMKAAGLPQCDTCRGALAQRMQDWAQRLPRAQGQEIVEHARRLAAKQQAPGVLADMARAIREAAQVWKGKG